MNFSLLPRMMRKDPNKVLFPIERYLVCSSNRAGWMTILHKLCSSTFMIVWIISIFIFRFLQKLLNVNRKKLSQRIIYTVGYGLSALLRVPLYLFSINSKYIHYYNKLKWGAVANPKNMWIFAGGGIISLLQQGIAFVSKLHCMFD